MRVSMHHEQVSVLSWRLTSIIDCTCRIILDSHLDRWYWLNKIDILVSIDSCIHWGSIKLSTLWTSINQYLILSFRLVIWSWHSSWFVILTLYEFLCALLIIAKWWLPFMRHLWRQIVKWRLVSLIRLVFQ
jgi:hypothetical protein